MNPFFRTTAFTSTGNQIDADAAQERLERLRGRSRRAAVRSKSIPGFNVPADSSAGLTVPSVQPGKDKKTNYVPYVVAGAIAFFLITR